MGRNHSVETMDKPGTVKWAALLWAAAVGAGVIETALAVSEIATEGGLDAGVWINVVLRSIVYTGAALLILAFSQGRRWARTGLAVLLSVIGLAAMVVPSAMLLADGETFADAFGSGGSLGTAFLVVRMAHIAAVLGATALMFAPSANAHFKRVPAHASS